MRVVPCLQPPWFVFAAFSQAATDRAVFSGRCFGASRPCFEELNGVGMSDPVMREERDRLLITTQCCPTPGTNWDKINSH